MLLGRRVRHFSRRPFSRLLPIASLLGSVVVAGVAAMQKLAFSGLSSGLDRLRSLRGSDQVASRVAPAAVRSSDAITYGSFTNLKLTAGDSR